MSPTLIPLPLHPLVVSQTITSWSTKVAIVIFCRFLFAFKERNTVEIEEEKYCIEYTKLT